MTAENFCYWLKGILEIQEAGLDKNTKMVPKLSEAQIDMINQHLNYVFLPRASSTGAVAQLISSDFASSAKAFIC